MKRLFVLAVFLSLVLSVNAQTESTDHGQEYYNMIHEVDTDVTVVSFDVTQYVKLRNTSKKLYATGIVLTTLSYVLQLDNPLIPITGIGCIASGFIVDWIAISKFRKI